MSRPGHRGRQELTEEERLEYEKRCKVHNDFIVSLLSNPEFRRFIIGILIQSRGVDINPFTGNSQTYFNLGKEAVCKRIEREFYKVAKVDRRARDLLRQLKSEIVDVELLNLNKD